MRVYVVHVDEMSAGSTAERIVAAAMAIVTDEGADAVTMRRVAADVGLSTMATYRHFPGRTALLQAVTESANAELGKNWTAGTASTVEDRVLVLLGHFLDFVLSHPHLYSFLMTERRADARKFPEDFRDHASPAFTPLLEVIEEGMRDGSLRSDDDPLEAAMSINAVATGLVQLYLAGRIGCSEQEFRQLCVRSVRRVLRGLRP
ncbi:transcriptional regulator, TetR family [Prauserella sp. Am3]|nr:transcriptional regulator, TetR family [Prauserella sp. Am3]